MMTAPVISPEAARIPSTGIRKSANPTAESSDHKQKTVPARERFFCRQYGNMLWEYL
jgi:hypothetical protein